MKDTSPYWTVISRCSQHDLNRLVEAGKIKIEKQHYEVDGHLCGTYYTFTNLDGSLIHTFYTIAGCGSGLDIVDLTGDALFKK